VVLSDRDGMKSAIICVSSLSRGSGRGMGGSTVRFFCVVFGLRAVRASGSVRCMQANAGSWFSRQSNLGLQAHRRRSVEFQSQSRILLFKYLA
jgi:hypothetical protein